MKLTRTIAEVLQSKRENRILSIPPDQTVYEAIKKMAEYGVGALLVMSDNQLLGLISERDYARKVVLKGHVSKDILVREIMTIAIVSVNPRRPVDECMAIMTEHRFRHLPVIENDAVVGVVSLGDVVKWIISEQEEAIHELESYIVGSYPA
ncbi:MAG: CBS domain-containing protein [Terriglobales bacterium]